MLIDANVVGCWFIVFDSVGDIGVTTSFVGEALIDTVYVLILTELIDWLVAVLFVMVFVVSLTSVLKVVSFKIVVGGIDNTCVDIIIPLKEESTLVVFSNCDGVKEGKLDSDVATVKSMKVFIEEYFHSEKGSCVGFNDVVDSILSTLDVIKSEGNKLFVSVDINCWCSDLAVLSITSGYNDELEITNRSCTLEYEDILVEITEVSWDDDGERDMDDEVAFETAGEDNDVFILSSEKRILKMNCSWTPLT